MKRFMIRNYGPSRQVPYKAQTLCIEHDGVIETDDVGEAAALAAEELMHVTDRNEGSEPVSLSAEQSEKPETPADEIAYDDMNVKELKAIAKDRQLDVKGQLKADLIKTLQAYDDEPDKPEETAETPAEPESEEDDKDVVPETDENNEADVD